MSVSSSLEKSSNETFSWSCPVRNVSLATSQEKICYHRIEVFEGVSLNIASIIPRDTSELLQ